MKTILISTILLILFMAAHATDKELRHLTQITFDEYLVQMNWVNECTSSMTIIEKKSQRVIQTIPLEGDSDNLFVDSGVVANESYLEMKDCDKDGHKDLWLLTSWGTEVWHHKVYRFNPKTGIFVYLKRVTNDRGKVRIE